ncbi:hypothetical protein TYRP_023457 [Tyrophagus putrescentiae]|nr:hypothetical protein TYRP_023457 [Tyrophagus putrescentiae]
MSKPAAHPDVTWPLSTPSSSGLARCARETLVVAQAINSENGENGEKGSESTQPEPQAVQLLR